jgi:bla regulator protein BlaR1
MNAIIEQINLVGAKFVDFTLPMLIQSVVLILILLLVDLALRKKLRAVFRYWIWMLVLVKLVLPTSLTSPLSLGYLIGDRLEYVESSEITSRPKAEPVETKTVNIPPYIDLSNIQPARFTPSATPKIANTEPIPGTVVSKVEPKHIKHAKASLPVTPLSWQGVVFLLWLAAVIAMSLLLLQRAFFVMGLLRQTCPANNLMIDALEYCQNRMKVRRNVRLKVSFNATSPAVCGLFRPVILLPQNLGPTLGSSHLRTVIMHELAHIKRGDLWVNTIQVVLQIFYLYNPLLWLANSMIRRIREQAVDETVLVAMGPKAQQYPEMLLNVARLAWQRPALSLRLIGVIESKSQLKERIRKMLERPAPKSAKLGIAGILIIIALGAFLLPMAKAQNSEEETSKVAKKLKAEKKAETLKAEAEQAKAKAEQAKAEAEETKKEAEIKMLQDKITQLEKHLNDLLKQVQQKKSLIAVVEAKAKEQSDLIKKEKQKAEKEKDKATKEKAKAIKEKANTDDALVQLNLLLKKFAQEKQQPSKEEQEEQLEQLNLLLKKFAQEKQQKVKEKEAAKEKDKAKKLAKVIEDIERIKKKVAPVDKVEVDVVVAPKPMPKPTPHPKPVKVSVPVVAPTPPAPPAPQKLPKLPKLKLPKLPKIMPPPTPEMPVEVESINVTVPKVEPPKDIIQQIGKVHKERAHLKKLIGGFHKELDKRKESDNISDEQEQALEQQIEALEHKHQMLGQSAKELENKLQAWSEQLSEKMAHLNEKIHVQVRQKVEKKHEEQHKQHERQMQHIERQKEHLERQKGRLERQHKNEREKAVEQFNHQMEHLERQKEQFENQHKHEHEKAIEQFNRQMEHFKQQMEKWSEQHEHQMEKFNKEIEVSVEGLEGELDNMEVEVDIVMDEKADADADADVDVVVDGSKEGEEKATFTKGPNILTAQLDPGKKIIVKNRIGSINVSSGKAGQCKCSITIKASAETIEQARLKAMPVKIEVDDDDKALYLVVVKTDNDEWNDINVDLNIQVPLGSDIVVNNDIGNLKMINLEGKIQGRTKVGDIFVSNIKGDIKLLTDVGKLIYEVPEKASAEVRGSTNTGTIKTELPLDVIKNFQKSQISGVLGEGEDKVDLKTKVGNITIRKARPPATEEKPVRIRVRN